jgi:uncharacterized protein YcbK (DUF882 family)
VPIGKARLRTIGFVAARTGYSCGLATLLILFASRGLQNAVAEGDTRTISLHHIHTNEDITITYKRDGQYDEAALEKLNWFLRDWRKAQSTRMDPHLIDVVWEVQREAGVKEPIQVVCGYRSPETNEMLRHHSSGVARFSQHMLGKAMDFYIPGVALADLRADGLRLERGGVGFYPTSGSPFVHMDTGGVRMWPRMTRDELTRVFPDGRTVLIPTDGHPLSGYAMALADLRKRGNDPSAESLEAARSAHVDVGSVVASAQPFNPFAKLLGLAKDDDEDDADAAAPAPAPAASARTKAKPVMVAAAEHGTDKKTAPASAAAPPKMIRAVAAAPAPAAPSHDNRTVTGIAALTPNQTIAARGYWQAPSDTQSASKAALRGSETAAADTADATGSVTPWSNASKDHASPLALGFAAQPGRDAPQDTPHDTPAGTAAQASAMIGESNTTIAVKGVVDRPPTRVQKAVQLATAAVHAGVYRDSPWLRALVLSPSVHRFLTTLALGAHDLTTLTALMVTPTSSVVMTFSTDPNPGLTDHFSGSAVVFLTTVSYPPTRTASLQ